jgi:predicted Zn-dependent protease
MAITPRVDFAPVDRAIKAGALADAQTQLEALMERHPTQPGVLERMVMVLRQQEQWPAVQELLLEARNRYGLWPDGSDLLLGQSLVEQGQMEGARAYLETACLEEDASWAHHFLGKVLRSCGELEAALEQQQLASEALPGFLWAPYEAAELLWQLGRPVEALLEAKEAQRRSGPVDRALMEALLEQLQPAQALLVVERCLEQGDQAGAERALRQGLREHPQEALLLARAGELLRESEPDLGDERLDGIERELNAMEALLDALEQQG